MNTLHTGQLVVASSGTLLGIMLIMALVNRPGGMREGNRLLAAALACNLSYLLLIVAVRAGLSTTAWFLTPSILLYATSTILLLGYVRAITSPGLGLRISHLIHLLPPLLLAVSIRLIMPDSQPVGELLEAARAGWPPNAISLAGIGLYLLQSAYLGFALLELRAHRKRVPGQFSYTDNVTLTWLRLLIGLYLVLSVAGLVIALARLVPGVELWPRSFVSMTTVLVVNYLIAFKALSQPALFEPDTNPEPKSADSDRPMDVASSPEMRSQEPALPPEVESHYWGELQATMKRNRPHLDSKLRIADLAAQLDMPVHHLSQTINRRAEESFSDYINRYRVEEAKTLLTDTGKAITTVAFDAGFNSESAFYRHFKNFTGKTPKQFRLQLPPELTQKAP